MADRPDKPENTDKNTEWEYQQWKGNKLQELKYHRAICMMMCGSDLTDVAKELGTSKKTVQRFFDNPQFNENLTRAMQLTFKTALSKAALYADKAVDLLIQIAEDINTPTKYRLQAISQINDICFKAGLQNSTDNSTDKNGNGNGLFKMNKTALLLSTHQDITNLSNVVGDRQLEKRLNEDNRIAIWNELYPDEPYPTDASMREHFNKNELGIDSDIDEL